MSLGRKHRRKVTFKICPGKMQEKAFVRMLGMHCDLYNAALQERMDAYAKFRLTVTYNDQQNMLPALKEDMPELVECGSMALQETLRRVDRAFQAFFARVKTGQASGFPRFKSKKRFDSFCFPAPAGWNLQELAGA